MRIIYTSKGEAVKVDDADFDWLNQYRWYLIGGYATTTIASKIRVKV